MPSSEECLEAQQQIKSWAVAQLVKEGHAEKSALEIVRWMPHDEQIKLAEKIIGPICRGAYSPYG